MNKKILGLASLLMIFVATSAFSFSPAGKKYRVTEMNGENISGYAGMVDVFITFTDKTLTLETVTFGVSDKQTESYTYNDKTKKLVEIYDGGRDEFTINVTLDGMIMSNSVANMVLVDITDGDNAGDTLSDLLDGLEDLSNLYDYYDYY